MNKDTSYIRKQIEKVTTIFLLYMFMVFPLFMHSGYLDITLTKYRLFTVGVLVYGVVAGLLMFLEYTDKLSYSAKKKSGIVRKDSSKCFLLSDICMVLFLLSGLMALIMADSKTLALTGSDGRRIGFFFIICAAIMYFVVSFGFKLADYIMPTFSLVAALTFAMAVAQHIGFDPFGLLSAISSYQRAKFVATFGNINVFGSFVCLTLILAMGLYIFEEKQSFRIIYGACAFLGGGAILAANSDLTYSGLGVGGIALLFVAVTSKKMYPFFKAVLLAYLGMAATVALATLTGTGIDKLTGIGEWFANWTLLVVMFVGIVLALFLSNCLADKCSVKTQCISWGLFFALCGVALFAYGATHGASILTWTDKWGDYRGYIWSRLLALYGDFPVINKIFGNGNESIYQLMSNSAYAEEMYEITGVGYDSSHNMYLQYLVTMGAFGLISYVGFIATSVAHAFKKGGANPVSYVFGCAIISFAVQEFFNVGQPVTTPYIFLMCAMAAGLAREGN